jgi:hypothetical protein
MVILENSLLTSVFLVLNLAGLFFMIMSYLIKKYEVAIIGMLIQLVLCLAYFFVCYLNSDIFVLAVSQDFTANLVYFVGVLSLLVNSLVGSKMYHQHRVVSAIILQLGIFLGIVLIVTQLSDTAYNYYLQNKRAEKLIRKQGFNQTGDFESGKADSSKDTLRINK